MTDLSFRIASLEMELKAAKEAYDRGYTFKTDMDATYTFRDDHEVIYDVDGEEAGIVANVEVMKAYFRDLA